MRGVWQRIRLSFVLVFIVALCAGCQGAAEAKATHKAIPAKQRDPLYSYGWSVLSQAEQSAYDVLVQAIVAADFGEVSLETPIDPVALERVGKAVQADHPLWSQVEVTGLGVPVKSFRLTPWDVSKARQEKDRLDAKADRLLDGLPSDPVKALEHIHDRLLDRLTYRQEPARPEDGTVYGALINGTAICNGYSRSFQYLCQKAGFPCYWIEGVSVRNIPHSWNMVYIYGDWKYVDVTWDESSVGRGYHDYLLVTLQEMDAEHFPSDGTPPLPEGNSPGYYERCGYSADTSSPDLLDRMADAFVKQLGDYPPKAPGTPVYLEIKLTGSQYENGRKSFQQSLFPLLRKIDKKARDSKLPFTVETTGSVEYNFNDTTKVLMLFPIAKHI